MYRLSRHDVLALTVLVLLLATIICLAVLEFAARQSLFALEAGAGFAFWQDTFPQWAMAVLALAATAISLLGVKLLRQTFVETKRTADAAVSANATSRDNNFIQNRPWLAIEDLVVDHFDLGGLLPTGPADLRRLVVGGRYKVVNKGNTPALSVGHRVRVWQLEREAFVAAWVEEMRQTTRRGTQAGNGRAVAPHGAHTQEFSDAAAILPIPTGQPNSAFLGGLVTVSYMARGTEEVFETVQGFIVTQRIHPNAPGFTAVSLESVAAKAPIDVALQLQGPSIMT